MSVNLMTVYLLILSKTFQLFTAVPFIICQTFGSVAVCITISTNCQ